MNEYQWKRCVIYTRVSSQSQVSNWNWLKSQEALCRDWANRNWVEVVKVFTDWWVSWKYDSRKWLDAMIQYLIDENKYVKKIDFVFADDIDRLSRDVVWWNGIKDRIINLWKADIHTAKQNIENSIEGRFSQNIIMSVKQFEREANARRSVDRKKWRLLDWYWVFYPPLWYEYTWKWNSKILSPTSDAPVISSALTIFAEWGFDSEKEFSQYIHNKLPNVPVRTAENVLWDERLLLYAWFVNYPNYWINMIQWKHKPIISVDVLDKIKNRKKWKNRYLKVTKKEINDIMILRWHLVCPVCWNLYWWWPSYNKFWNPYYYYRCLHHDCPNNKSLNVDIVHRDFWNYLKTLEISDSEIFCFKKILIDLYNDEKSIQISTLQSIQTEILQINWMIEKLLNMIMWTDDVSLMAIYQWKLKELNEKKSILQAKMDSQSKSSDMDLEHMLDYLLPIIKTPFKLWSTWDVEIMQLVPGVVFDSHFMYSSDGIFTTPWDGCLWLFSLIKKNHKWHPLG